MKSVFPLDIISGPDLGISYSSLTQVGHIQPVKKLGEAQLSCYTNIANGNVIVFDHLLICEELSIPIQLQYIYNSKIRDAASAWRLSHKQFKEAFKPPFPPQNSMTLIEEDGHETTYTLHSTTQRATWLPPRCGEGRPYLQYDEETQLWIWFHPMTRITEYYDQKGRLVSRTDQLSRVTNYEYADDSTLSKIKTPSGNEYHLVKTAITNGFEHKVFLNKPDGSAPILLKKWLFDAKNRLVDSIIFPRDAIGEPYHILYDYDARTNYANQISSISQTDNSVMKFRFDNANERRLTQAWLGNAGATMQLAFRAVGQSQKNTYLAVAHDGAQSTYQCDDQGQLLRLERTTGMPNFDKVAPEVTLFSYQDNQIQSITHPNGGVEQFSYLQTNGNNLFSLPIKHQFPDNREINYFYDASNHNMLTNHLEVLADNTQVVHRLSYQSQFVCDGQKSPDGMALRFRISPEGRVTEYRYDKTGQISSERIYVDAQYSTLAKPNTPIAVELMEQWAAKQDASRVSLKTFKYNAIGQIIETTIFAAVDKEGNGVYDNQTGVIKTQQNMQGSVLEESVLQSLGYNPAVTTTTVDALQRPRVRTNALSQVTQNVYDLVSPDKKTTQYKTIQPNGREDSYTKTSQEVIIEKQTEITENGKLQKRSTHFQKCEGGWTSWIITPTNDIPYYAFYDHLGQLSYTVNMAGIVKGYFHDETLRYTSKTAFAKTINPAAVLYKDFPNAMLLSNVLRNSGMFDDSNNRVELIANDTSDRLRFQINAEGYLTETQYDRLSNITAKVRYATKLTPDQIKAVQEGKVLNLSINPTKDRCTRYFYNKDSIKIAEQDAAGYITEYKSNAAGWITETIVYTTAVPVDFKITDFNALRPKANTDDAHSYAFYNNRGLCEIAINAEGVITQTSYLANGLEDKTRIYAEKVNANWYLNTQIRPILPAKSPEDAVSQHVYDLLDRTTAVIHANDDMQELTSYNIQNLVELELHAEDEVFAKTLLPNGDTSRGQMQRYNGFGQIIKKASPLLIEKIALIEADKQLKPEEKVKAEVILWDYYSERYLFDDNGLLLKTITSSADLNAMPLNGISPSFARDIPSVIYYDLERRPIIHITFAESNRLIIQEDSLDNFGQIERTRLYSQAKTAFPKDKIDLLLGGLLTDDLRKILDSLKDEQDIITEKKYNKVGECTEVIDGEGYPSTLSHNAFHECVEEKHCLATKTPNVVTTRTPDIRGNIIETELRAGNETPIITKKEFKHPLNKCTQTTSVLGAKTDITLDRIGRPKSTETKMDGETIKTATTWDNFNRPLTETNALHHQIQHSYHRKKREHITTYPLDKVIETSISNGFGEQIEHRDALANSTINTHNASGAVLTETNPLNATTKDIYDARNAKIASINAKAVATEFLRDGAGQLLKETADSQDLKLTIDYTRNALNQAEIITRPTGVHQKQSFNKNNAITCTLIDPSDKDKKYQGLDLLTTNTINGQNQTTHLTKGSVTKPNSYDKDNLLDGFGRKNGEVIDPNGLQLTSTEKLNAAGQTIASINAEGATTWHIHNALGQKRFEVDTLGGVKEWVYNQAGHITQAITYETLLTPSQLKTINDKTLPSTLSIMIKAAPKQDACICYLYDACERERFAVTLLWNSDKQEMQGSVIEKEYDIASREIKTTHYAKTISAKDIKTATLEEIEKSVKAIAVPANDAATWKLHDACGQIRFIIDAENYIEERRYDAEGLLVTKIQYANATLDAKDLANTPIDKVLSKIKTDDSRDRYNYRYFDALDRCIFEVNGEGAVTSFSYDKASNCTQECRFNSKVSMPTSYDSLLSTLKALVPDPAKDRINKASFDANNRCTSTTDALGFVETYTLDSLGNRTSRVDKMKNTWLTEFDRANRAWKTTMPAIDVTTIANVNGKLVRQVPVKQNPVNTKIFNKIGQTTEQKLGVGTSDERTVAMHHNLCGSFIGTVIDKVPVDNGTPITQGYRPDELISITTEIYYNSRQRKIASKCENGYWTFYIRDNEGHLIYKILPNGATTHKSRDAWGRVTKTTQYANPFNFMLAKPYEGLTCDLLTDFFKKNASVDDRTTTYTRDRRGNPITVQKGAVYEYLSASQPVSKDKESASKNYSFNAFNEVEAEHVWVNSKEKQSTFSWHDRAASVLFEALSQGSHISDNKFKINAFAFNAFKEKVDKIEYSEVMIAALSNQTTAAELQALIAKSDKDRHTSNTFDLHGQKTEQSRHEIIRQKMKRAPESGIPSFDDVKHETLSIEKTTYNGMGSPIIIEQADGNKKYQFFDACQNMIAVTGITQSNLNSAETVTPLSYLGNNIHGQLVSTTRFKEGTNALDIKIGELPQPKAPNPATDPCDMRLFDIRGNLLIEQDPRGNPTNYSRTRSGQVARKWLSISDWQQDPTDAKKITLNGVHLDIEQTHYNVVGIADIATTLRDNIIVNQIHTDLNLFGQPVSRWLNASDKQDIIKYDTLGYPWYYLNEGVPTVVFHNFQGMRVYSADSPKINALSNLTYDDLPALVASSLNPANQIEYTEITRDLPGRIIDLALPGSMVDTNTISTIPLDVCVGKQFKNFGEISISWPKVQEQTLRPVFTLTIAGQSNGQVLNIITKDDRSGVDVNAFASDRYQYTIDYYFDLPGQPSTKVSQTTGEIYLVTANNMGSKYCIPYFISKGIVGFAGNTTNCTSVEVYQNNTRVGQALPVKNNTIDMNGYPSGVYQFKPNHQLYSESMPITVFTALSPAEDAPALTYEIPTLMKLSTLDTHGALTWKVPELYNKNAVELTCVYKDTDNKEYTETWTVAANAPTKEYKDADGKVILSNFSFKHPVKEITTASLSLQMKTAKGQELLPLYQQQVPTSLPPVASDLIHHYPFTDNFVVYMCPVMGLTKAPEVSYLNTLLGSQASPIGMESSGFTSEGFTLDVTGFSVGDYPLTVNGKTNQLLTLTKGNACFLDFSQAQPIENRKLVKPSYHYDYDCWDNKTEEKNPEEAITKTEYNDVDAKIKVTLPAVTTVDEHGVEHANFCAATAFRHNDLDMTIGETKTLSNGTTKSQGWLCDAVNPITQVLADGSEAYSHLWNGLGLIYKELDAKLNVWLSEHDLGSNLTKHTSPEGMFNEWTFDEANRLNSSANKAGDTYRYSRDFYGNISDIYQPEGNHTIRLYDCKRNILEEIIPQEVIPGKPLKKLKWNRDFYGHVKDHTDLGGAVTTNTFDGKFQLIEQQRITGNPDESSPYVKMYTTATKHKHILTYHADKKPFGNITRHLRYTYALGRCVSYKDELLNLLTEITVDKAARPKGMKITNTETNQVVFEQSGELDALGREIQVRDGIAVCQTGYDDENQRRYVKFLMDYGNGLSQQAAFWWKYDALNHVVLCGELSNGNIILNLKGYELTYEKGLRATETKLVNGLPVTASLKYDNDARLHLTNYSNGEQVERLYNNAGRLWFYTDKNAIGEVILQRDLTYTGNGQTKLDKQTRKDATATTDSTFGKISGVLEAQTTTTNYAGRKDPITDASGFTYRHQESNEIAKITITRTQGSNHAQGASGIYTGPNGELNAIIKNEYKKDKETDKHFTWFTATPGGLVLERNTCGSEDGAERENERFYHNLGGNILGKVKTKFDGRGSPKWPESNGTGFIAPPATGNQGAGLYSVVSPQSFVNEEFNPQNASKPAKARGIMGLFKHKNPKLAQAMYGEGNYAGNGTSDYMAVTGDDYKTIAKKIFGDESLESSIKLANGGQEVVPGQYIQIPQLMPSHNGPEDAIPYQVFIGLIQGNILPHVQVKQSNHLFVKQLVSLLTMGIALMIALPTGGVSIGLGLGAAIAGELGVAITSTFTISVVTGIVAGIVQAAEQLVLVGLRVQDFKIAESISTAFAGFTGAWSAAGTAAKSPILASLTAGKINIAEQLTLMAIGKQQHFDFAQAAAVMINTSVDPQIAKGLEGVKSIPQNVVHTASSTAINYALNGRLNWEQVAAQMLSNQILETIQSVPAAGMGKLPHQEPVKQQTTAHKTSAPKAPAPKKHHTNATKENVYKPSGLGGSAHKRFNLGGTDLFGVNEGLISDSGEKLESYIPSINKKYSQSKKSNLVNDLVEYGMFAGRGMMNRASKTANTINKELHLDRIDLKHLPHEIKLSLELEPGLFEKIHNILPRSKLSDNAIQFWSDRELQTGNHLYAIPKTLALLGPTAAKAVGAFIPGRTAAKTAMQVAKFAYNSTQETFFKAAADVPNKSLTRAEIIQESNSRSEYLRSKYGSMSSQERLAKIDFLAGENYTRRLFETIDQGDGVVFRYLSEQGLKKSLETGSLRGYTTTKFSSSSSEVANGAQIFPEWGIPEYGAAIPVSKLSGFKLARPMGNSAEFGWELYTNSYPKAGAGHWSQFLIDKVEIENAYIFRLNK